MASFNRNVAWRIGFQAVSADEHLACRLPRGAFKPTTGWKPFGPSQARHGTSPSDWRTGCLTSIDFADRRWADRFSIAYARRECKPTQLRVRPVSNSRVLPSHRSAVAIVARCGWILPAGCGIRCSGEQKEHDLRATSRYHHVDLCPPVLIRM